MAETPSTMLPLGTKAPDFNLLDSVTQQWVSLHDNPPTIATVIFFICNHCPYVKHIQEKLVAVAHHYQTQGIRFIAINSNDAKNYPADSLSNMAIEAKQHHYPFPYLYDETQVIAKAYQAACTPDFYIFNRELHCVYRGRFDGATPKNQQPVTGEDLSKALDQVLAGKKVEGKQLPSLGCNIKWKKESFSS